MRRLYDWLFLSDQQYFGKYVVPARLGDNPYRKMVAITNRAQKQHGFIKRMLIAVFS